MTHPPRTRLRGPTLVAAPMVLVGMIGASATLATALWAVWNEADLGAAFVVVLSVCAVVTIGGFAAARGCFVEAGEEELRDVVAWVTRRRIPRERVVEARVLAGGWRWFEIELDDATLLTLVGASPAQLTARLLPGWQEQDLADLSVLRGEEWRQQRVQHPEGWASLGR